MRKKATPVKKRTRKIKVMNQKDEAKDKVDKRSAFMIEVDKELDALRVICYAIEGMDEDAKARTFRYLKNKYGKEWPSSETY